MVIMHVEYTDNPPEDITFTYGGYYSYTGTSIVVGSLEISGFADGGSWVCLGALTTTSPCLISPSWTTEGDLTSVSVADEFSDTYTFTYGTPYTLTRVGLCVWETPPISDTVFDQFRVSYYSGPGPKDSTPGSVNLYWVIQSLVTMDYNIKDDPQNSPAGVYSGPGLSSITVS